MCILPQTLSSPSTISRSEALSDRCMSAERKRRWQKAKCASDADFRDNDALALLDELYASLADRAIEVGSQIIGG